MQLFILIISELILIKYNIETLFRIFLISFGGIFFTLIQKKNFKKSVIFDLHNIVTKKLYKKSILKSKIILKISC